MPTTPDINVRGRIEGLDGLRAIATMIVVLVHMGLINKAGWMAVQEFFLMSGFLISRVLLDLKLRYGAGRFFGEFLTFRVLRIIPAYFSYLILLAIGAWLLVPSFFQELRPQFPYLFTFTFNYAWLWTEPSRSPWLGHLWSLSVEEQFYLLWPMMIWLTPIRRLPYVLYALIIAGPLLRYGVSVWGEPHAQRLGVPVSAVVWIALPSYLDAFAMGTLLCFNNVRVRLAQVPNRLFALLALATIVIGYASNIVTNGLHRALLPTLGYPVMLPHGGQYLWGYTVVGLLLMILMAKVCETGFWHGLLRLPLAERVGKVAYSLYLVHHGLLLLFALYLSPWLVAHLGVPMRGATLIWAPLYFVVLYWIANLSFEWIEQPAMQLKRRLFVRPSTGVQAPPSARTNPLQP